jgi:hypothetical protein
MPATAALQRRSAKSRGGQFDDEDVAWFKLLTM